MIIDAYFSIVLKEYNEVAHNQEPQYLIVYGYIITNDFVRQSTYSGKKRKNETVVLRVQTSTNQHNFWR